MSHAGCLLFNLQFRTLHFLAPTPLLHCLESCVTPTCVVTTPPGAWLPHGTVLSSQTSSGAHGGQEGHGVIREGHSVNRNKWCPLSVVHTDTDVCVHTHMCMQTDMHTHAYTGAHTPLMFGVFFSESSHFQLFILF